MAQLARLESTMDGGRNHDTVTSCVTPEQHITSPLVGRADAAGEGCRVGRAHHVLRRAGGFKERNFDHAGWRRLLAPRRLARAHPDMIDDAP